MFARPVTAPLTHSKLTMSLCVQVHSPCCGLQINNWAEAVTSQINAMKFDFPLRTRTHQSIEWGSFVRGQATG